MTESLVMFGGRYAPYSNFYSRPNLFQDDDDVAYCSSEQCYQSAKAKHLGNDAVATEIMAESDPVVIKHLGESISGDMDSWREAAPDVMEKALMLKFSQNDDLLTRMKQAGSRTFVECNKYDRYWGIGLAMSDPEATDPEQWNGKNLLGKTLDRVRDELTQ